MITLRLKIEHFEEKYHVTREILDETTECLLDELERYINEKIDNFNIYFKAYYDVKTHIVQYETLIEKRIKESLTELGWRITGKAITDSCFYFDVLYVDDEEYVENGEELEILNDGQYESDGQLTDLFEAN